MSLNHKEEIQLEIHKCFDSYLGKIKLSENKPDNKDIKEISSSVSNIPKLVIILDISSSMGNQVERFIQKIIPGVVKNIKGSNNSNTVTLITFESEGCVKIYENDFMDISQLKNITAKGCTYMAQAVDKFYDMILNKKYENKIYRILTLSDGELFDQDLTMKSADKLKQLLLQEKIIVNSQALRLFTSSSQPDTRGLSSMLQLTTKGKQMLVDIDCNFLSDELIINIISELYQNDGLGNSYILKSKLKENCLQEEPWFPPNNSLYLFPGINSFWINLKSPKDNICKEIEDNFVICNNNGNEEKIKCIINDDLSEKNYQELIKDKIDFYFKQLKVFKIVNTEDSLSKMDKIISFFNNLEEGIFAQNSQPKSPTEFKLYERSQTLKNIIKRRQTSLTNKMREIRNDDKINQLNSKQQAEYLREININDKTGKSLAKRAIVEGLEFDKIIRKEVEEMSKHIKELDSIDESKLTNSFYSTCNTLDGIRAVCNFYQDAIKDNISEDVTANDIMKLINIVGVAGNAKIGNYPDPMTYRINNIYPSTFISLSDILTTYELSGGQNLKEIGTQNEINISVPYFEDEKIQKFLMKYSPKLLEYHASIAMRRILADVLYTSEYLELAGLWAMVPMLLKDKKEINIKIFVQLVQNYMVAAGEHFTYVLELLDNQKEIDKDGLSIYIANNGCTNMISPMVMFLQKNEGKEADEMIKRITRAVYQFEINQFTKKNIRAQKTNDPESYIKSVLIKLLKLDLENDKTKVPELFQEVPKDPVFSEKYDINDAKFNEIMDKIWWADYILITPLFLKASIGKDPLAEFKKIEMDNITEEIKQERLGIHFSSKLFKLYCIVQGYIQHEQAQRSDSKLRKMKILDLGVQENAEKYVKDFIKNIFKEKYEEELKERAKKEKQIIAEELAQKLINVENIADFNNLLKNGIKKGIMEYKLEDHTSLGFDEIINNFGNKDKDIKFRKEKIFILLTGKDEKDNQIWNDKNKIKSLKTYYPLKNVLDTKEWGELIKTMKKRGIHIYRNTKNRQGHCNGHESYWAKGFNSIQEMMSCITKEEYEKYVFEHQNCCGFYNGEYRIMRRCEKGIGVAQKIKNFKAGLA